MGFEAWIAVAVIVLCLAVMVGTRLSPDVVMLGGLALLIVSGIVPPHKALAGFSNEGVLTIACLYVVAAGLRDTGALDAVVSNLLGRPKTVFAAQLRLMLPVTLMSSLINNTPVVATFIPALRDWSRRAGFSISRLMLPLSYAAIFGGTCTLIGTSTNLVVNGMMIDHPQLEGIGFFELAWVGLPIAVIGTIYVLALGSWLIPDRMPAREIFRDPREYTVEMIVEKDSPLIGQTVEQVGLRHLPGLYLIEIDRDGNIIAAVSSAEKLRANDRLIFAGVVESVVDLLKIRGLQLATDQLFKLAVGPQQRRLVEAVVSDSSPIVGQTIREGRFRNRYRAVVIAVARNGERIRKKVGDIRLRPGDTLLLETRPSFVNIYRNSRDFLLVSPLAHADHGEDGRSWLAWLILLALVTPAILGWLSIFEASILGAGAMLATRCCTLTSARRNIDTQVLLVIAAAFGLGNALSASGAAEAFGTAIMRLAGDHPLTLLMGVYFATSLLTNFITNNAAAVLMFPITLATADGAGISFLPFAIVIMLAASASFATPIGYQTNLMVYGPGGYLFRDYLRIGLPLTVIIGAVAVLLVPIVWPF